MPIKSGNDSTENIIINFKGVKYNEYTILDKNYMNCLKVYNNPNMVKLYKNLRWCYFEGINFKGMKLNDVDFSNSILKNSNFENTLLTNVIFKNANIDNASFLKSNKLEP